MDRIEFERIVPELRLKMLKVALFYLADDNEAEDICVYPSEDGALFHIVDYDKLINTNINHYKPTEK